MAKKRPSPTPEQIAHLTPGNRKGMRHKITKKYAETLTDLLITNHEYFLECLAQLSPKDYAFLHFRMAESIIPKKIEATIEDSAKPVFTIISADLLPEPEPETTTYEIEDKKESND